MRVSGQLHTGAILPPEKEFRFDLNKRLEGLHLRSGLLAERIHNLILPGIEHRPYPERAVRQAISLSKTCPP